jgi:tRNA(Ile)-lysidine synthase TilS/MesJ
MNSSTVIEKFWREHPQYWLPVSQEQKFKADKEIYETFWDYNYEGETLTGRVIFLDQFQRHFQRVLGPAAITDEAIKASREEAADDVDRNGDELITLDEVGLVFCMMPFKHLGRYEFIFEYIHNIWLPDLETTLRSQPQLAKFYYDTYRKWQTDAVVASQLIGPSGHPVDQYEFAEVADEASSQMPAAGAALVVPPAAFTQIFPNSPCIVSLSGGVDSMLLLTLLKAANVPVYAVHIIYRNRGLSCREYSFVATYCKRLDVPLLAFEIPYLRRDNIDREFYEQMTRELRFAVYRVAGQRFAPGEKASIILGHIKEDVVENVWTNFAKRQHLACLAKMETTEEQLGVTLLRPFLHVEKHQVFEAAAAIGVPYLKNTTPSWSNRGKFREHFHAAIKAQYGTEVDDAVLATAAALKSQAVLIDRLLYNKIYESWDAATRSINIQPALEAELDADGWLKIFEHVCHKRLGASRPSIHAIREFCRRLALPTVKGVPIPLRKGLQVVVCGPILTFYTS